MKTTHKNIFNYHFSYILTLAFFALLLIIGAPTDSYAQSNSHTVSHYVNDQGQPAVNVVIKDPQNFKMEVEMDDQGNVKTFKVVKKATGEVVASIPVPAPLPPPGQCGNRVIDPGENCDPPFTLHPNKVGFFCNSQCQWERDIVINPVFTD